jgi:2-succinyl-6-hydroxy-2,4-cyclohexadiene-1-carboxylate synthase
MPRITLAGQSWYYQEWGKSDSPAVVLLHGFTGSHQSWMPLAHDWSQEWRIIAPDLPGHGQTETPDDPQGLSLPATADRLCSLLDHLSIAKAAVIGYSMGGRLALVMAVRHQERLSKLILESASPGLADAAQRRERRQRDDALADDIESRGLAWFVPYWADQPLFMIQPESLRECGNQIRYSQSATGLAQSLRGAGTGVQAPVWDRLQSLKLPVLIVTGALDTKFCAIAERMAALIPNAQWVCTAQAGHTVHGEQPHHFDGLVRAFFDRRTVNEGDESGGI